MENTKKPYCQASESAFWKADCQDHLNTWKSVKKTPVFSLKAATNLKSIKLKTEDVFCLTFTWLITSYHWTCYSNATAELYRFFCLCFLIISFSFSVFNSSFCLLTSRYFPILLPTLIACSSSEGTNHCNITKSTFTARG